MPSLQLCNFAYTTQITETLRAGGGEPRRPSFVLLQLDPHGIRKLFSQSHLRATSIAPCYELHLSRNYHRSGCCGYHGGRSLYYLMCWVIVVCSVSSCVYRQSSVSWDDLVSGVCVVSSVGSHSSAVRVQSREVSAVATLCAHAHLRRRCMAIQSSRLSFFIRASASCVHLRIQSTQGSKSVVSLSSLGCGGIVGVGGALSTSSSSSSVFAVVGGAVALLMAMRLGACKIIRSICLCVRRNRFSNASTAMDTTMGRTQKALGFLLSLAV